ncbi:MAG: MFS transporter [Bryobacteraceae bacterium]
MLFTAAILGIFVYGMIAAMLGTILPDLSNKFSLSPKQNGNIALIQAVGLMIGSFTSGPLMDIYGKQVGMLLGLALIAVSLIALRRAAGYTMVALSLLVLGYGGGVVVNAGNSLNTVVNPDNPSSVANLLNLFFGVGALVTPLVAANLFKSDTKKITAFAATLALVALAASIVAPYPKASGQMSFNFGMAASLLANPKVVLPALLLFLYVSCEVGVWNWLVRHLIAQGVAEKRAMTILSLGFALGLIVGRVGISRVLLSVDPRTVLIGAAIAMAITTFLMLQSSSPTVAWAAVFIAGLAMAPVFPTTLGVVGKAFMQTADRMAQGLPAQEATAMGIVVTVGWCGIIASSPIIGGIAGDDPKKLKKALLLLPAASIIMAGVAYAM